MMISARGIQPHLSSIAAHILLEVFDARRCRRDRRCIFAAIAQPLPVKHSSVSKPLRKVGDATMRAGPRSRNEIGSLKRTGPFI